ncbi:MAG: hypothetical protein LBQ77_05675 [Treponema sp.]|nr:hypothetical protein [Treponema sp.]
MGKPFFYYVWTDTEETGTDLTQADLNKNLMGDRPRIRRQIPDNGGDRPLRTNP